MHPSLSRYSVVRRGFRAAFAMLVGTFVLVLALKARADQRELELGVSSHLALMDRYDALNAGAGVGLQARWGLLDFLDVQGSLKCEKFRNLKEPTKGPRGQDATGWYNATRCSVVPGLQLRFGWQYITMLSLGAGYRTELQSEHKVADISGVLLASANGATKHELISEAAIGWEARLWDVLSAAVRASAAIPLLTNQSKAIDLSIGIALSVFIYP